MTARHDAYAGFAGHYDLHGWDWYAGTYGARLRDLLAARGSGSSTILEAGCGTGTLALDLARAGFRVTGVDLSEPMLGVARAKDAEKEVTWRHGDVTRLDLGTSFDVVTCVADILNHLESLEDWARAFRAFAAHLRPGGFLFFDVMTCLGLQRLSGFTVRESERSMLVVGSIWEPSTRRSTMRVTSFVAGPGDTGYRRAAETITEWGQPVADVLETLASSGFSGIERPFSTAADPEDEERLAVLARRE